MNAPPASAARRTDVLIVGAGPVGLFQVFALGLLELQAIVADALPEPGGQCRQLYPDKPIYDIPGLPVTRADALVANLERQAAPFQPGWLLGRLISRIEAHPAGADAGPEGAGFCVHTDQGDRVQARAIVLATGAGAFLPRSLGLPGLEAHRGRQLRHDAAEADDLTGRQVVVVGDGEAAVGTALALAERRLRGQAGAPAGVTLTHRREQFRIEPAMAERLAALRGAGWLRFVAGQPQALEQAGAAEAPLSALVITDADGQSQRLALDLLLVRLGLSPRLGPLADWGLALERKQVLVTPDTLATSLPGVHAVGDIAHYPGKRKLLLCGFHEATLAAWALAARLREGGAPPLEYTTTSSRLQRLLAGASPHTP